MAWLWGRTTWWGGVDNLVCLENLMIPWVLIAYTTVKQILTSSIAICRDHINPWFFWVLNWIHEVWPFLTGDCVIEWPVFVLNWFGGKKTTLSSIIVAISCCKTNTSMQYKWHILPFKMDVLRSIVILSTSLLPSQLKETAIYSDELLIPWGRVYSMLLSCLVFLHCRDVLRSPCPRS